MDTDKKRISSVESHQGQRFQKRIEEYQSGAWNEIELTRFLYDDWNLIAEYDATNGSNDLDRTYTWGLDLSLSPQGAGGVGGLLSMTEESSSETYFYAYDANGNVTQLVDQSGNLAAHYEYSPFGQPTTATGPMADANPYRFSTKYQDQATGLLYYGFRYYDAETGRWPSRDPIGEDGGVNLYSMVGNDAVNAWDYLGLICEDKCPSSGKTRNVKITDVSFSYGLSRTGKPADLDLLDETIASINAVASVQNVAGAGKTAVKGALSAGGKLTGGFTAGEAAVVGVATDQSKNLVKQSPSGSSGSLASKLIGGLESKLAKNVSARIHVTVSFEKCEKESCLIFCDRLDWQEPESGSHPCSFGNPPKPADNISDSEFQTCFSDAIKKFKK